MKSAEKPRKVIERTITRKDLQVAMAKRKKREDAGIIDAPIKPIEEDPNANVSVTIKLDEETVVKIDKRLKEGDTREAFVKGAVLGHMMNLELEDLIGEG